MCYINKGFSSIKIDEIKLCCRNGLSLSSRCNSNNIKVKVEPTYTYSDRYMDICNSQVLLALIE